MRAEQPVHEATSRLTSCDVKHTETATGDNETIKKRLHSAVIKPLKEPKPSTNKPATETEVEELLRTKIREEMESQRTPEAEYTEI